MERPKWLDEAAKTDWEKVKRDSIARRITQLSLLEPAFSIHTVKNSDKKKSDVIVFDSKIVRELWCKMITVIDELNTLKEYIVQPLVVAKGCEGTIGNKDFITDDENEDVATIMQWHKDTFPMATCAGQLEKWEEERKEFDNAIDSTEKLKELVDMFIVACAIMRFNVPRGAACLTDVCALREHFNFSFLRWKEEIAKKMKKNRARKWEYLGNGNYHHVKGVED